MALLAQSTATVADRTADLPPPRVKRHGRFWVVRDDLIDGGTKVRALLRILPGLNTSIVAYAADCFGFGPRALANATHRLGVRAVIVFPAMDTPSDSYRYVSRLPHVTTVVLPGIRTQNEAYEHAREIAESHNAHLFPIGFDTPQFTATLASIASEVEFSPREVWALAGSGCLARALQVAWPSATVHAVSMGFPHVRTGNAIVHRTAELPDQPARVSPPYPSANYYDAKVWSVASAVGADDALIWNVA
jgi:hypothetical protein